MTTTAQLTKKFGRPLPDDNGERGYYIAKVEAPGARGNGSDTWSFTGECHYGLASYRANMEGYSYGQNTDAARRAFPEIAELWDLMHMADGETGEPSNAVANAWYHLTGASLKSTYGGDFNKLSSTERAARTLNIKASDIPDMLVRAAARAYALVPKDTDATYGTPEYEAYREEVKAAETSDEYMSLYGLYTDWIDGFCRPRWLGNAQRVRAWFDSAIPGLEPDTNPEHPDAAHIMAYLRAKLGTLSGPEREWADHIIDEIDMNAEGAQDAYAICEAITGSHEAAESVNCSIPAEEFENACEEALSEFGWEACGETFAGMRDMARYLYNRQGIYEASETVQGWVHDCVEDWEAEHS